MVEFICLNINFYSIFVDYRIKFTNFAKNITHHDSSIVTTRYFRNY